MRVGVIVQARMTSRRLPGKVLRLLAGRPVLQHVLERVVGAAGVVTEVVATSDDESDDPIARFCADLGFPCVRGPLDDVASRMVLAATTHDLDGFVRVCADSPLMNVELIDRAVALFRDTECDVVSNTFPRRTWPRGRSIEVVRTATLATLLDGLTVFEREHVTTAFYRSPERFRIVSMLNDTDEGERSLVVDEPADLERLEALFAVHSPQR